MGFGVIGVCCGVSLVVVVGLGFLVWVMLGM